MNSFLLNQLLSPTLSTPASNRNCSNINRNDDDASASSRFQRTVCVYDWWLVKAEKDYEGKRLAVAGFTSREQQAMRVFTSAPIVKRYDVFTLETADEICIVIKGFINKSRTMENGFSSEVFGHFMFGFPPYWEAYAEKFLVKEFMAGTGLFPDYNKAVADLEFAVDAGMANPNSNAIPRNHEVNGKSKHNAGDMNKCSEYVSEITTTNASKNSDSPSKAADHCDFINEKTHVSNNLPPSTSCDIGNVSSQEDNLVVRVTVAIPSSYHVTRSSGRMANSKSRMKGNGGIVTKSKTEERANSKDVTMMNAASGESPVPKGSDVDYANPSNLDPAVSLGNSEVELKITSSEQKTNVLNMGLNINKSSDLPAYAADRKDIGNRKNHASQNLPRLMSCDMNNVSSREDNLAVPAEPSSYHIAGSSERMVNVKSSMKGKTGTATNSKPIERAISEDINMKNAASVESPFPTGSHVDNNNPSNLESALSLGSSEVALRITSSWSKTSQKQKEIGKHKYGFNKNSSTACEPQDSDAIVRCIGEKAYGVQSPNLLNVGPPDETGNTVKNDNVCGEPQKPSHSTSVKVNSKPGKGFKKESQASSRRQNKNNLAKCHNGPVSMNHNCNSKTTVGGGERNVKLGSSREKARKKINFDADACSLTPKTKENSSIVSTESLSLKRSRAGRLLVPSLDFWRNQIAIYDADRKITGLQEGLEILNSSKGIPFDPPNKK